MIVGHTSWKGRAAVAWCAAVLALTSLSGCAPSDPGISPAAAKQLQAAVVAVTQAAASGDIAGAGADLNTLERALREATASGEVSAERTARIQASIALVRADLAAAPPPSRSPSPTATAPASSDTHGTGGDKGKGKGK